jgi:hypothetical protein
LKYCQGVFVEVEANPQLMLYAVDAPTAFGDLYGHQQGRGHDLSAAPIQRLYLANPG